MQFVYPSFLWALTALAIPLLIHIFNFRRVKKIYFPNVALLKEVKAETNFFRRLKHLLVLLMRLLFVFFLVLAFAQPFIPSPQKKNFANTSSLVSLYIDNSFSMQSLTGNEKYLDLATVQMNELVKVFPKETRFQLLTNQFENKEQYPIDAKTVEDRLSTLDFAPIYRSLAQVLKRQLNLIERQVGNNQRNQIFWFSDFQKSTSGDLNKIKLDTTNNYFLIPIRSERTPNLMVDSVWLANPFIKAMESNQLNIRIRNFSKENYKNIVLKLFIDERQVSTANLSITANSQANAFFNFTVDGKGYKKCKITFEDFPVIFDNEYFFVLNASPTIKIINLTQKNTPLYITQVFSNENVFSIKDYDINNIDYKLIESANVVVLNEINQIEGDLKNVLRTLTQKGGSIVLIPPAKPDKSLVDFLNELGVSTFKSIEADSTGGRANHTLAVPDINNPFFAGVFEKSPNSNMEMPVAYQVLQWSGAGNHLLSYKNGKRFFSEYSLQKGKIYVMAAPLQKQYSNFARFALFVPVMYKIASLSKTLDERVAYNFQEKIIRLKIDKNPKNQLFKIVQGKNEYVPSQQFNEGELLLEIPEQITLAGHYELRNPDNTTAAYIALNYAKDESKMDFYSPDELKSIFAKQKNVQIFDLQSNNNNFITEFKNRNIQVNLWKYMLIIAIAFVLAEVLIIRFM
ncbi:MAG: hypothetical protein EAZ55_04670 [Cytophagales bacterium]|nr:MAG: hypothetical protein EAZ55_04670 [Cytophagales bacterium]